VLTILRYCRLEAKIRIVTITRCTVMPWSEERALSHTSLRLSNMAVSALITMAFFFTFCFPYCVARSPFSGTLRQVSLCARVEQANRTPGYAIIIRYSFSSSRRRVRGLTDCSSRHESADPTGCYWLNSVVLCTYWWVELYILCKVWNHRVPMAWATTTACQ